MSVPLKLIAGDTWAFKYSHADYEAPTWDAVIYFENATATFNAASSDDGSNHAFSIAASSTSTYVAGRYKWQIRVNDGTTYLTVADGWVDVLVNPAASGPYDHRSWARRTLAAVEAFLEGNATTAQQAMSIAGRSISRWSITELTQLRKELRAEVRANEQAERAGLGRNIKARYGTP